MKNLLLLILLSIPFMLHAQSEYQEFKNDGDQKYAQGNYDDAIKNYKLALKFSPNDGYAKQRVEVCKDLKKAKERYERGELSSAESTFKNYNSHPPANYYLGMISKNRGDLTQAISYLEKSASSGFPLASNELDALKNSVAARIAQETAEQKLKEEQEAARIAQQEAEERLEKEKEAARIAQQEAAEKLRREKEAARIAKLKADKELEEQAEAARIAQEEADRLKEENADDDSDGVRNADDDCRYIPGDLRNGCPKKTRFKVEFLGGVFVSDYQFGNGNGGDLPIEYIFEDPEESFGNYIDTRYQAGLRFDCFNPYSALNVMWDVKYMNKGFITTREDFTGINVHESINFHSVELPFYFKIHGPKTSMNPADSPKKRKVSRGRFMLLLGAVGSYNFGMQYKNETDASQDYDGEYMNAVNYGYTGGIGFEGAGKKGGIKISLTYDNYITDLFNADPGDATISGSDVAGFSYDNQAHYGLNISIRFW